MSNTVFLFPVTMEGYMRECRITELTELFPEGCEDSWNCPEGQFITFISHSYRNLAALQEGKDLCIKSGKN
jgi:hypothetical protein